MSHSPQDLEEFQSSLKHLAKTSLSLLKAALYDPAHDDLFQLEFYARVIGMFELNNYSIDIPTPLVAQLQSARSRMPSDQRALLLGQIQSFLWPLLEEEEEEEERLRNLSEDEWFDIFLHYLPEVEGTGTAISIVVS